VSDSRLRAWFPLDNNCRLFVDGDGDGLGLKSDWDLGGRRLVIDLSSATGDISGTTPYEVILVSGKTRGFSFGDFGFTRLPIDPLEIGREL
jgi:hypothetical protein